MKYFSKSNQYINAECQNCGRVLKIPKEKCIKVLGGLSVTSILKCKCGIAFKFIEDASSNYQKDMSSSRAKNDHHMPELIELIEHFLPVTEWNFRISAQYINYSGKLNSIVDAQNYYGGGYPYIFYNSQKCRIRIEYSWSSREYERSIYINYGRLETPDNAGTLLRSMHQETYHHYWHSVFYAIDFLDGISPQEAKNSKYPRLVKDFKQSNLAKSIRHEPEKDLALHATIWETYGQKIFDIFDTKNKDLWERYSTFISEYWKTLP